MSALEGVPCHLGKLDLGAPEGAPEAEMRQQYKASRGWEWVGGQVDVVVVRHWAPALALALSQRSCFCSLPPRMAGVQAAHVQ